MTLRGIAERKARPDFKSDGPRKELLRQLQALSKHEEGSNAVQGNPFQERRDHPSHRKKEGPQAKL